MTPEDDQTWLDALAGRAGAESPAACEAANVRAAMLRLASARETAATPAQDRVREATLIARARRDGLLPEPRRERWRWLLAWNAGFAVAALAAIAIGIGLYMRATLDTEPVVRDAPDGIVRINASDPAALKQQLIEELRAAGVAATGYEVLGRHGIDADLPQPLTNPVRQVLEKHGIPPPPDFVLRIEIVAQESQ
jgi:hypothetical protein